MAAARADGKQDITFILPQQNRGREGLEGEAHHARDPLVEAGQLVRFGNGLWPRLSQVGSMGSLEVKGLVGLTLLRAGTPHAILIFPNDEVEFYHETVTVFVNQRFGVLFTASVRAEESEGHGVKHGGFACAVSPGEDPERRSPEGEDRLVTVAHKAFHVDTLWNHSQASSASNSSARARSSSLWGSPARFMLR